MIRRILNSRLLRTRIAVFLRRLANRYVGHQVGLESAALAFYLIFALFPFLIVISALLSFFRMDLAGAIRPVEGLLPAELVKLLRRFVLYVSRPSPRLVISSLAVSFYFPMRATNSLMLSVRRAYHLGSPRGFWVQVLKNLLYTIVLMGTVALTVLLMTVSNHVLAFAVETLGLPAFWADLWAALRFPVTAVVVYFALYFLYALAQDTRQGWQQLWPGTLAALIGWLLASYLYALYVNRIAHYSVLYGSIATVMVLLIWLNLSAISLIMGAEFNGALMGLHRERAGARADRKNRDRTAAPAAPTVSGGSDGGDSTEPHAKRKQRRGMGKRA